MLEVQDVQRNLARIRMRGRLFWSVLIGGFLLAIILVPTNYAAAKVAGFLWVIVSIATWMSPMMNHCPSCHKPFFEGWFPSGLIVITCANCGIQLDKRSGSMPVVMAPSSLLMLPDELEQRALIRRVGKLALGVAVFGAIFFLAGELMVRLVFWEGESFSAHGGPIVQRFEKNVKFNRFDGPSRGPAPSGPKQANDIRIVIQGDSITWGQGVRNEERLFSNRLLTRLRETNVPVDMAVLARPGREIDEHVQQLKKWGYELQPDVIIYQWYINDIELEKEHRPRRDRLWRHLFFHSILQKYSYLWFFMDFSLDTLLPSSTLPYEIYMSSHFKEGSAGWLLFERYFSDWTMLAKELAPRVIVTLYPHMSLKAGAPPVMRPEIADIHTRMLSLCRAKNLICVDLSTSIAKFDDSRAVKTGPFDNHPSVAVHDLIADALYGILEDGKVKVAS